MINRKVFILFGFIVSLLIFTGCQSINDVMIAKQNGTDGTSLEYEVTKDDAWNIAKAVLRWRGVEGIEEHKDQNYMVTSTGVSIGTAGTVIGVWIENGSSTNLTKVTVITKRKIATNLITSMTEGGFHTGYKKALAIFKNGKAVPLIEPNN